MRNFIYDFLLNSIIIVLAIFLIVFGSHYLSLFIVFVIDAIYSLFFIYLVSKEEEYEGVDGRINETYGCNQYNIKMDDYGILYKEDRTTINMFRFDDNRLSFIRSITSMCIKLLGLFLILLINFKINYVVTFNAIIGLFSLGLPFLLKDEFYNYFAFIRSKFVLARTEGKFYFHANNLYKIIVMDSFTSMIQLIQFEPHARNPDIRKIFTLFNDMKSRGEFSEKERNHTREELSESVIVLSKPNNFFIYNANSIYFPFLIPEDPKIKQETREVSMLEHSLKLETKSTEISNINKI